MLATRARPPCGWLDLCQDILELFAEAQQIGGDHRRRALLTWGLRIFQPEPERWAERKAAGRCWAAGCEAARAPGRTRCAHHLEEARAGYRRRQTVIAQLDQGELKPNGPLCAACGRPMVIDLHHGRLPKFCARRPCINRRVKAQRAAEGRCRYCESFLAPGSKSRCARHLAKHRIEERRRLAKRQAAAAAGCAS